MKKTLTAPLAGLAGLIVLVLTLGLTGCSLSENNSGQVTIEGDVYTVRYASSDEERRQGLSHVTDMQNNEGMLFVYAVDGERTFWMKDTPLDLTAIWIRDKKVVGVTAMKPCMGQGDNCAKYNSPGQVDMVLEIRTEAAPNGYPTRAEVLVRDIHSN